jgi:hypothetical protein
LVTALRGELIAEIRRRARAVGVMAYQADGLSITPHPVIHTNHPSWGYLLTWCGRSAVGAGHDGAGPAARRTPPGARNTSGGALRALDGGKTPSYGEVGREGADYRL